MPANGRCEGCGREGPLTQLRRHTATCPEFLALFRRDPGLALDPAESHERHHSEEAQLDRSIEREERSTDVRARLRELARRRQERARRRWAGVTSHRAEQVSPPERAVLRNLGRSEAQVDLIAELTLRADS